MLQYLICGARTHAQTHARTHGTSGSETTAGAAGSCLFLKTWFFFRAARAYSRDPLRRGVRMCVQPCVHARRCAGVRAGVQVGGGTFVIAAEAAFAALSTCPRMSARMPIHICIRMSIRVPIHMFRHMSIHMFNCTPIHMC